MQKTHNFNSLSAEGETGAGYSVVESKCGLGVNISGSKVSGARVPLGQLGIMFGPTENVDSWKDWAIEMSTL